MNTLLTLLVFLQIPFCGIDTHFKDTVLKTLTINEITETTNAYIIFAQEDSLLYTIVSLKTENHSVGECIEIGKSYEFLALTYLKKQKQFISRKELKIKIFIGGTSVDVPLYGANILLPVNLNGLEYCPIVFYNRTNNKHNIKASPPHSYNTPPISDSISPQKK